MLDSCSTESFFVARYHAMMGSSFSNPSADRRISALEYSYLTGSYSRGWSPSTTSSSIARTVALSLDRQPNSTEKRSRLLGVLTRWRHAGTRPFGTTCATYQSGNRDSSEKVSAE